MRLRKLLWLAPVVGAAGVGVAVTRSPSQALTAAAAVAQDGKPAASLPVSQVILFNSGVGYFARAGEVDGNAKVDLTFPETDINDLLKSLTLQDFDGGRVDAVSYDSREPVGRTLASYAINLSANPTLAQILTQVRGERVEVAFQPSVQVPPANVVGTIVGLERVKLPPSPGVEPVEADAMTILTADGLRTVRLPDVLRVKFQNPALEAELKRALETLARSHDAAKKAVTLQFSGEGKRKVKVGYVVETPIWKTSYRLVLDKDQKPALQGWAMVENPSDEDWTGVKMALVSGRPISFRMDLYNPLYATRPVVEPELFASLRPPAYQGDIAGKAKLALKQGELQFGMPMGGFGGGGIGGGGGMAKSQAGAADAAPAEPAAPGIALRGLRAEQEQMDRKKFAAEMGKDMAGKMDLSSATAAATAGQLGDYFQYLIDHPVTVQRQKSAMLPVVNKPVEGTRVSIYNPAVQAKHPLLGLRFKNTSGANLAQGPITVFEGSSYAGDSRVMDLQPNEERLIAYAIDLGTEVVPQNGPGSADVLSVRAKAGLVTVTRKFREEKVYKAVNRSATDRTLVIEHPNRTNQQFKLVDTAKPVEETADLLRFQLPLKAGATAEFKVIEERTADEYTQLNGDVNADTLKFFLAQTKPSPALRAKLEEAVKLRAKYDQLAQDRAQVDAAVTRITQDQDRIRKNLRETPRESAVYAKYLAKLDAQEKELDALTDRQKALADEVAAAQKAYTEFLMGIDG